MILAADCALFIIMAWVMVICPAASVYVKSDKGEILDQQIERNEIYTFHHQVYSIVLSTIMIWKTESISENTKWSISCCIQEKWARITIILNN